MRRRLLALAFILGAGPLNAAPGDFYSVQVEVGIAGADPMPVTMTVRENSTGTLKVSDGKDLPLELQVTVSPSSKQAPDSARVNVAFLISQTKDGQKKLVGDPGMELTLGTIGTLSLSGADKSSESLSLRVSVAKLAKPVDDSG